MLSSITRASVKPTQMASRAFISTWNAVPQGKHDVYWYRDWKMLFIYHFPAFFNI